MWLTLANDFCTAALTLTVQLAMRRLEVPIMRNTKASDELYDRFIKPAYGIVHHVVHEASCSRYVIFRKSLTKKNWGFVEQRLLALVNEVPDIAPRQFKYWLQNPPDDETEHQKQLGEMCRRIAVAYLRKREREEFAAYRVLDGTKWQALTNMAYERHWDLPEETLKRREKVILRWRNDIVARSLIALVLVIELVLIVLTAMHKM